MGCQLYTSPGTYTFTWPDGVDRAVVGAQGGSGGGADGTPGGGRAGGGGGAFAERLVLKTDATATVVVGSGGVRGVLAGTDGVDSGFTQASSGTEYVSAAAGKGASGPAGGAGGTTAASYGTIKYKGGTGGTRNGDSGGGGGATACATGDGDDGNAGDGTGRGLGGDICGGTPGAGGGGGYGGGDTEDGEDGPAGGGGGGGTDGIGGNAAGGSVSVCWSDPLPTGYCIDGGSSRCNKWWPACGQYGYTGGMQCFYYGYPYFSDQYSYNQGWELVCCPGKVQPSTLTLTIIYLASYTETFRMFAVNEPDINGYKIAYRVDPTQWRTDGTSLFLAWAGGSCSLVCWDGVTLTEKVALDALSCNPVYLARQMPLTLTETPSFTCASNGNDHTFIITE